MIRLKLLTFLFIIPIIGFSQKIRVKYESIISNSESYDVVLVKSIELAKEEALRKAGVLENISSFTSLSVLEDNESFKRIFNSWSFTDISGAITKWRYIKEPTQGFNIELNSPTISFTIEANVKKYKTKKDPSFKAKVIGIKSSYKDGEYADFNVRFYQDSYINVFYISPKESSILYPIGNHQAYANKLYKKNETKEFSYIQIETKLLAEYGKFLIVITKEYYPYMNVDLDEYGLSTKTDLESIMQWIFSIERNKRDEYFHEFIMNKD